MVSATLIDAAISSCFLEAVSGEQIALALAHLLCRNAASVNSLQVAGAEDEQVIEHLWPAGADEPFADRVRPRGPEVQLHDFDAFRTEDLIEADAELGVAVPEQEPGLEGAVLKPPGQVPSLLSYPLAGISASPTSSCQSVTPTEPEGRHPY